MKKSSAVGADCATSTRVLLGWNGNKCKKQARLACLSRLRRAARPLHTMSDDAEAVVVVVDGALRLSSDAEAASSSPAVFLRAWGLPGAYTACRSFGRDAVSGWEAHVARLRHSLTRLSEATPTDFAGVTLPVSDKDVEALVAPSVALALAECAARGIEGPSDGARPWLKKNVLR